MTTDEPTSDKPDPVTKSETVRLIYEHTKDAPELLIRDGNDLDTKGIGLIGAASVVMGLASFGSLTGSGAPLWAVLPALAIAAGGFLFAAYHSALLLGPTKYTRSSHADDLYAAGKWYSPAEVMDYLITSAGIAYEKNKVVVESKADHLKWMLRGLSVEVVGVTLALIVSRL